MGEEKKTWDWKGEVKSFKDFVAGIPPNWVGDVIVPNTVVVDGAVRLFGVLVDTIGFLDGFEAHIDLASDGSVDLVIETAVISGICNYDRDGRVDCYLYVRARYDDIVAIFDAGDAQVNLASVREWASGIGVNGGGRV